MKYDMAGGANGMPFEDFLRGLGVNEDRIRCRQAWVAHGKNRDMRYKIDWEGNVVPFVIPYVSFLFLEPQPAALWYDGLTASSSRSCTMASAW